VITPGRILAALVVLASAAPLPAGLEGRFDFSERPGEREALEQAIEGTARQLSFLIRPIARSRLRAGNRVAPWVEIHGQGDQISIRYQGRSPMVARADGTPTTWKNEDGSTLTITHRLDGPTLVQVLRTGEGARTNRFSAGPDGSLRLAVEITSPRLPVPLRYSLTYGRPSR
jgi:hypothetical protein